MISVLLLMAITLDGKIAKNKEHVANWTSKEDKEHFAKVSKEVGVVLMGRTTFETLRAPLKDRLNVVFTTKTNNPNIPNVRWVNKEPRAVLSELEKEGVSKVILAGGSRLNTTFLRSGLINEVMVTIEPTLFGQGLSLFDDFCDAQLELISSSPMGKNSLLVHYKVL